MDEGRVRTFLTDFDGQVSEIGEIYARLEDKAEWFRSANPSPELVESAGYWLHNLYSAYEDLFKLVASYWENQISEGGGYHVNLLRRMRLSVEGVRPPLISEGTRRHLDELRAFRHVFRHAYSYGLDAERVAALLRRVLARRSECRAELERFRDTVGCAAGAF